MTITVYPPPPVSGTVSTIPPTTPALVVPDGALYDDEGIPYVNPNVAGADIATGDKQSQQLTALQALQAGVSVSNFPASQPVAVSNFPATQPVSGTVAISGTVATTPSTTPTLVQNDDRQYDDDGIPYVNPNVPGADIATGDKQTQTLTLLATALPRVVAGTVGVAGAVSTLSTPQALAPNAAQETTGQLQRVADLLEALLTEMRVMTALVSQQSQPTADDVERLRADFTLSIN